MLGHVLLRYNPRGVIHNHHPIMCRASRSGVAFFGDTKLGILLSKFLFLKGLN